MMLANRLRKTGSAFLMLWGLLHMMAGIQGGILFARGGPRHLLETFGYPVSGTDSEALITQVGHLSLTYSLYVAVIGLMAVWGGILIWRTGSRLACWFNAVLGGLTDLVFLLAIVIPGYVSWGNSLPWFVTYVVAMATLAAGMKSQGAAAQGTGGAGA